MNNLNGFRELQIEDTRNVADGVQHATLMNVTGASGSPYSSGEGPNFGQGMPAPWRPPSPTCTTCGGAGTVNTPTPRCTPLGGGREVCGTVIVVSLCPSC